jgi:S13-like protein
MRVSRVCSCALMCLLVGGTAGERPGLTWALSVAEPPAVEQGRITTVALPTLTPEQRAEALAKAAEARKARSELLASIKSGERTIASVLGKAKEDKTIGKTKVAALLKAVPGLGAVKVAALLEQAGIDPDRRAAGLGDRQRSALIDALN